MYNYNFEVGDILNDHVWGLEWIVRSKLEKGVVLQLNKEGGTILEATPDSCRIQFSKLGMVNV